VTYGASPLEWLAIVRRADIKPELKLAAFIIASYADMSSKAGRSPGEGIHPGLARFALDMRCSYATAQRRLAWLRDVGLLELTFSAGPRSKFSDEYRLTLSTWAIETINAPDPTEYDIQVQELRETHKKQSCGKPRLGITQMTPKKQDQVTEETRSGINQVIPKEQDQVSTTPRSCINHDDAPPRAPTRSDTETTDTSVRTSRSPARERCPRHPAIRIGPNGCAICRSLNR
jgi:hypothetical protein